MIDLRGAPVALAINAATAAAVAQLPVPPLMISLFDPAAEDAVAYSRQQVRAGERLGILVREQPFAGPLEEAVADLNADADVTAIFLHEPAPASLRELILAAKDPERPTPNTAVAVMELLDFYEVPLDGIEAVVVGRSATVGRPVVQLLLDRRPGPTVTVCHTGTVDLTQYTSRANVVIAAAGHPRLVRTVRPGAVVIDVGINIVNGEVVGDVDHVAVANACAALTPVPGGLGPVTVACLMRRVAEMADWRVRSPR